MRSLFLLAGAAALVGAAPALSKPAHAHASGKVKAAHVTKAKVAKTKVVRITAHDRALARRYGGALCPPGLWKKTPQCMPPGQNQLLFREGQRVTSNYRLYTPYANIPLVLRNQYDLNPDYRYIYRDNAIYVVDPMTRIVRDIINAVVR